MSEDIDSQLAEVYRLGDKIGKGAYGTVFKAERRLDGTPVAIKKICSAFKNAVEAQKAYREVMYLRALRHHQNIVHLYDVHQSVDKKDLYLVFELVESDLHAVSRFKVLTPQHRCYILYQLFKVLKYLHSAGLMHRDLKPSNVLINSDYGLKLADFGLLRSVDAGSNSRSRPLSDNIATKWYIAPEILLGSRKYTQAIDIWSAGCIMAEILTGEALFPGSNTLNQIELIIATLGKPKLFEIDSSNDNLYSSVLREPEPSKTHQKQSIFGRLETNAADLLRKLLAFNPSERISAEEALGHSYFSNMRREVEELRYEGNMDILFNDSSLKTAYVYQKAIQSICWPRLSLFQEKKGLILLPPIWLKNFDKGAFQLCENIPQPRHKVGFSSVEKSVPSASLKRILPAFNKPTHILKEYSHMGKDKSFQEATQPGLYNYRHTNLIPKQNPLFFNSNLNREAPRKAHKKHQSFFSGIAFSRVANNCYQGIVPVDDTFYKEPVFKSSRHYLPTYRLRQIAHNLDSYK